MRHDLSFANRPLIVIEEIESTHFVGAVVRAKSCADAAVVSHDVETVLAVTVALTGQTVSHGAFSQCWHGIG